MVWYNMQWQYCALKAFSMFLCVLPYRGLLWFASGIGFLHYTFGCSQRRRAIRQLKERLGLDEKAAADTAKKVFRQVGRTLLEILYIPALNPQSLARLVTIENGHYLRNAQAEGKGVVLVTTHFGNWEWLAARLSQAGYPMAAIAQGQPTAGVDQLLNEYRQHVGMEPFARGSVLTGALKALRKGKVLGFLIDQDARSEGIFVNFFGIPTSTPRGPALFAIRTGSPIVPVVIIRHGRGYRILFHPPLLWDRQAPITEEETILRNLTDQVTRIMEARIREYPDHWWWFQRRWLTAPDGQRRPESFER